MNHQNAKDAVHDDELALLWRQLDTLRGAVADLIEIQRLVLHTQKLPETNDSSAATISILGHLDQLRDRLQSQRQEAKQYIAQTDVEKKPDFAEIDVERINVVEPDGTLRLVISNKTRAPDPQMEGKTFKRPGGNAAGIIFFNEEGEECGGLIYHGKQEGDHYSAGAGLMFDQFKQDQVIGVQHADSDGQRWAGLNVWDRPDVSLLELIERYETIQQMPEGPEKQEARDQLQKSGMSGAKRVFIGKNSSRAAVINLHDANGKVRLRLAVTAAAGPHSSFSTQTAM